jgi:hypothetical protein
MVCTAAKDAGLSPIPGVEPLGVTITGASVGTVVAAATVAVAGTTTAVAVAGASIVVAVGATAVVAPHALNTSRLTNTTIRQIPKIRIELPYLLKRHYFHWVIVHLNG